MWTILTNNCNLPSVINLSHPKHSANLTRDTKIGDYIIENDRYYVYHLKKLYCLEHERV